MKNLKLLTTIVILMVLINIALLLMLWMNRPPKAGPSPGGSARDYLVKELSLTAEQTKQYDSLRKGHHEAIISLQQDIRKRKEDLFATLGEPSADSAAIDAAAAKIAAAMALLDKQTYYHFRQVRARLLPGQQQKFDQVIQKALRIMQLPPAREGHEGPPGGGGEELPPPPSIP